MSREHDRHKWKSLVIQRGYFGKEYIRPKDLDLAFSLAYTLGMDAGAKETYEIFRPSEGGGE